MKKAFPRLFLVGVLLLLCGIYVLLRCIPKEIILYVQELRIPLFILTMISGFVFAFFIFVAILKKRLSFLPNLCIILGVSGYLMIALLSHEKFLDQVAFHALEAAFLSVVCVAAAIALYKKTGKYPFWVPLCVLASINSVVFFSCVFFPSGFDAVQPFISVICIIYVCGMIGVILYAAKDIDEAELLLNPLISCMLTASTVLGAHKTIHVFSPEYIISVLIIVISVFSGCKEFIILEKSHNELTKNFQKELERQTGDLRNLLEEREKLLRFLSHDMRKPVVSIRRFLIEVINQEKDAEQVKALNIIDMKVKGIEKNLTELASYSKMAYVAEQSCVFPLMDVINDIYVALKPDCDANGIWLIVSGENVNVFAKPNTLNSVITNLVMNAVEHSFCTSISIAVVENDKEVSVVVTDNGVGIETEKERELFSAYETTSSGEAHGLGLYICKTHMESMNGRITCIRGDGTLSFVVTMPAMLG